MELARAHARAGDGIAIASYLGNGDTFDRAIAQFAESYADQNERDYAAMVEADGRLPEEDRIVLTKTRVAVARWLSRVDRLTPAELLDLVLRESAYHFEIRGPRRLQARENLKKLRGLVRRIQNRALGHALPNRQSPGRACGGRRVERRHRRRRRGQPDDGPRGERSQFPLVFVVNVGRGRARCARPSGSRPRALDPPVSVADFQSEADEETQAREREEQESSDVALTRAREIGLTSRPPCRTACAGWGAAAWGSAARAFPAPVQAAQPLDAIDTLTWLAAGGTAHVFRTLHSENFRLGISIRIREQEFGTRFPNNPHLVVN
jgi:hypothetical protein